MTKSREAFRTISEVADWLGVQTHVLRFWESKFPQLKPVKRAGGRRYYRPQDMELLGGIKQLLHEDGMAIKDAQKLLKEEGVKHVASLSRPIDQDHTPAPAPAPETGQSDLTEPDLTEASAEDVTAEAEALIPTEPAEETPAPLDMGDMGEPIPEHAAEPDHTEEMPPLFQTEDTQDTKTVLAEDLAPDTLETDADMDLPAAADIALDDAEEDSLTAAPSLDDNMLFSSTEGVLEENTPTFSSDPMALPPEEPDDLFASTESVMEEIAADAPLMEPSVEAPVEAPESFAPDDSVLPTPAASEDTPEAEALSDLLGQEMQATEATQSDAPEQTSDAFVSTGAPSPAPTDTPMPAFTRAGMADHTQEPTYQAPEMAADAPADAPVADTPLADTPLPETALPDAGLPDAAAALTSETSESDIAPPPPTEAPQPEAPAATTDTSPEAIFEREDSKDAFLLSFASKMHLPPQNQSRAAELFARLEALHAKAS